MAETDPRDIPMHTATAYLLLYKEWVTQEELDGMEYYPTDVDASFSKLYRWDKTRAVMRTEDYQYRFFILKEEYDGKTKSLYADWTAGFREEHVGEELSDSVQQR